MFSGFMSRWTKPEAMRLFQPLENLAGHPASLMDWVSSRLGLGDDFEIRPLNVFHREPELAAGHPLFEPFDDIGVL